MRQIKFRACDRKSKRMIGQEALYWGVNRFVIAIRDAEENIVDKNEDIIVMQCTGLKDSTKWEELTEEEQENWLNQGKTKEEWNGKEIYEGNILLWSNGYRGSEYEDVVLFRDGCFTCERTHQICPFDDGGVTYYPKVIGNIYENQRLLERG